MNLGERIKEYRTRLHLTQEYIANYLGINRATVTQIELDNRRLTIDELAKLSILFGVSTDDLLYDSKTSQPTAVFARSFDRLDSTDQAEIMNLIQFKEMMKAQKAK